MTATTYRIFSEDGQLPLARSHYAPPSPRNLCAQAVLALVLGTCWSSEAGSHLALAQAAAKAAQDRSPKQGTTGGSFAAVAIHPSDPYAHSWKMEFTPTGFTARNVTLRTLTQEAFDAYEPGHLAGGPPWFDKTAFNVEAKIDTDEQPNFRALTLPQRRAMLQEVLEQRFHLETHTETRPLPAFALVVAKGGEKMHPTPEAARVHGTILGMEGLVTKSGPGVLEGTGLTSNQLSRILTGYVERPVMDRTGLQGFYDIGLRWSPEEADGATKAAEGDQPTLPSLYTVLQEQLGLRLEPTKSIVTIVVIDRADPPDAN